MLDQFQYANINELSITPIINQFIVYPFHHFYVSGYRENNP